MITQTPATSTPGSSSTGAVMHSTRMLITETNLYTVCTLVAKELLEIPKELPVAQKELIERQQLEAVCKIFQKLTSQREMQEVIKSNRDFVLLLNVIEAHTKNSPQLYTSIAAELFQSLLNSLGRVQFHSILVNIEQYAQPQLANIPNLAKYVKPDGYANFQSLVGHPTIRFARALATPCSEFSDCIISAYIDSFSQNQTNAYNQSVIEEVLNSLRNFLGVEFDSNPTNRALCCAPERVNRTITLGSYFSQMSLEERKSTLYQLVTYFNIQSEALANVQDAKSIARLWLDSIPDKENLRIKVFCLLSVLNKVADIDLTTFSKEIKQEMVRLFCGQINSLYHLKSVLELMSNMTAKEDVLKDFFQNFDTERLQGFIAADPDNLTSLLLRLALFGGPGVLFDSLWRALSEKDKSLFGLIKGYDMITCNDEYQLIKLEFKRRLTAPTSLPTSTDVPVSSSSTTTTTSVPIAQPTTTLRGNVLVASPRLSVEALQGLLLATLKETNLVVDPRLCQMTATELMRALNNIGQKTVVNLLNEDRRRFHQILMLIQGVLCDKRDRGLEMGQVTNSTTGLTRQIRDFIGDEWLQKTYLTDNQDIGNVAPRQIFTFFPVNNKKRQMVIFADIATVMFDGLSLINTTVPQLNTALSTNSSVPSSSTTTSSGVASSSSTLFGSSVVTAPQASSSSSSLNQSSDDKEVGLFCSTAKNLDRNFGSGKSLLVFKRFTPEQINAWLHNQVYFKQIMDAAKDLPSEEAFKAELKKIMGEKDYIEQASHSLQTLSKT